MSYRAAGLNIKGKNDNLVFNNLTANEMTAQTKETLKKVHEEDAQVKGLREAYKKDKR